MTATCTLCTRPTDGTAYACTACTTRAAEQLTTIASITPAARAVAAGQIRRGSVVAGTAAVRLPIDLAATARLDAATTAVTTWARHVAEERGLELPTGDPLVTAARWLTGQLDWLRHRPEVDEAYRDLDAAARVLGALVDGPAERRWLGQCGADRPDDTRCTADLHAHLGAEMVTCRACQTRHAVADRRAWLAAEVRAQAYPARDIERAYGIRAGTIRVWVHRGRLHPETVPLDPGVEGPREIARDARGRILWPLAEVLALAAQDAERAKVKVT